MMARIRTLIGMVFHTHLIPLLYTITIMLGIASYYASDQLYIYIPLTFVLVPAFFKLYEYVGKHKLRGLALVFLAYAFVLVLVCLFYFMGTGLYTSATDGDYYFFVWLLTPKEVLRYNPFYAAIAYMGYLLFVTLVAYYFTRIQYRIIVTAMIAFFPILTYGKDDAMIPLWVGIPLIALYFGVMIYARQLVRPIPKHSLKIKITPGNSTEKPVWDSQIWRSVLFFLVLGASVCMAVPKPAIVANRAFIDTALSMSGLTDYLMNAISDLTDSSNGGGSFNGNNGSDRVFAYVRTDEAIPLKTRTFTNYSFEEDAWWIGEYDQTPVSDDEWMKECLNGDINVLMDAISVVSSKNPAFETAYHLEGFHSLPTDSPVSSISIEVMPVVSTAVNPFLLSPASFNLIDARGDNSLLMLTNTGTVYSYEQDYMTMGDTYEFHYQSPFYFESERLVYLLTTSQQRDWHAMLEELNQLAPDYCSDKQIETVAYYYYDSRSVLDYVADCRPIESEQIQSLARELTKDCTNQVEQIDAICSYFYSDSFVYDLEYIEPAGANVETFLFETKRGVCYEFATAAVLMCRSLGIPARYVEGYSVNELSSMPGFDYEIRYKDSHAYVEVYLDGFGWCSIDPTIADNSGNGGFMVRNALVEFIGAILLAAALLVTVLYFLFWNRLCEAVFRLRINRMAPEKAVAKMLLRLRNQAELSESLTAEELHDIINTRYRTDLAVLIAQFSRATYGEQSVSKETAEQCYEMYCAARDIIYREKKKERKEFRKRGFKTRTP